MKNINIQTIRIDGGTQGRVTLNNAAVTEYAEAIKAGATFPPVVVFFDGTDHWLADGFHRFHAVVQAGLTSIAAEVRQGTARIARLHSFGANGSHGLRRTNEDKRKVVTGMLEDAEWSQWSDREIASTCEVGRDLVGAIRKALTVGNDSDKPEERAYITKHGTQAVMKTAGIGKVAPIIDAPKEQEWGELGEVVAKQPLDAGPDEQEMFFLEKALADDAERMRLILESDDALAAAMEKIKQLTAQLNELEWKNRGLSNRAETLLRQVNSLQKKLERMEKAAA